jgi:hypothetical protein
MKLTQYKPSAARHIMAYGPPKVGKTVAAVMLAMYGYTLWYIDGEDSIKSAWAVDDKGKRIIEDQYLENINLIRIPDSLVYPMMLETTLKILKGGDCNVCHAHGKIDCPLCKKVPDSIWTLVNVHNFGPKDILVIDSVTQLGNSAIAQIKMKDIAKGIMADDLKLDWDEWAKQGFLLDRVFSQVQTAPYNVIAISHEELTKMEDGKEKIVPRMGTRNFSKTSAKYFDDVVYFDKVNNKLKQFSSVSHSNSIITGSRTGKMVEKENSRGLIELFE